MKRTFLLVLGCASALAPGAPTSAASGAAPPDSEPIVVREDFDSTTLDPRWRVSFLSPKSPWTPAESALRGTGGGHLELAEPIGGDFDLTFDASTSEKTNVEVHLVDPNTGESRFTCAFLGKYHSVLQGARSCILAGGNFVAVDPRMWIWPGRRFTFRVRREGSDLVMSLDGLGGPTFSGAASAEAVNLRIVVSPETDGGTLVLDSIRLHADRPAKPSESGQPTAPPKAAEPVPPLDPAAAAIVEKVETKNLVVFNHADASFVTATIATELQRQYEWLRTWVGVAPDRIHVHIGNDYPCGFSRPTVGPPEMFLMAGSIFHSDADYAHEMLHCFLFRYGALPHWFGESMADMAYADAEISLWKRRNEAQFLRVFDRAEHRSYELAKLRIRFGKDYFPKVCRGLEKKRAECLATFTRLDPRDLAKENEFLLGVLSEAAGEDLRPYFRDTLGFDAKSRDRQRGY